MNKSLMRIFIFFFSLIGAAMAASTIDNYESYTSTSSLQNAYPWTGVKTGNSMSIALNTTGGAGGSKALSATFNFSSGQLNPWGYTGGYVGGGTTGSPVDWSAYDGVSFWVKASETGDTGQFIVFAVHEANGGDKYHSDSLFIKDLNPAGQYVYLAFADFVWYGGSGNGTFETNAIQNKFIFSKYKGTATQPSSASFLIDDLKLVSSISFVRNPYLQNVTQTSVKVLWGDLNAVSETIFWGPSPGNYTHSASSSFFQLQSPAYSRVHTAVISGLTAGQKVYYTIESSNWNDASYYAVAAPANGTPFRMAVYSDSQGNPSYSTHHPAVINAMIPHTPDIVLSCGDISDDGQVWQFNDYFFTNAAPLTKNTPFYTSIGNHDLRVKKANRGAFVDDVKNYRDLFDLPVNSDDGTEDYYAFNYGNALIICLNTEQIKTGTGYTDTTRNAVMKAWLDKTLLETSQTWKIVFFHKPSYIDFIDAEGWNQIFDTRNVQMVFFGHLHGYYANNRNGITYMTSSGGGAPVGQAPAWAWPNERIGAFSDHHFTQIDVTSSQLSVKVYNEENILRQSFNLDVSGNLTNNTLIPPGDEVDDFELYVDAADFQEAWDGYGGLFGGTLQRYYETGGASGTSNVMRMEISLPADSIKPAGYCGYDGLWDWVGYSGIKLWVKASQTGLAHDFQIRLIEGISGDKWMYSKPISSLNPNGEYIYAPFTDFEWYANKGSGDGQKNWDRIVTVYVGAGFDGTAPAVGSSSVIVDDITGYTSTPQADIDTFESYTTTTALNSTWGYTGVVPGRGDSMPIVLNTTGGAGGSQALEATFNFSSGQVNPKGYTGRSLNNTAAVDWSGYNGISVWLKGISETGNTPQYIQLAYHEGNGGTSGLWGDKFESAKVYLNTLDPAGEYVYLAFTDFTRYDGFGGLRDNNIREMDDIRSVFVFIKYDGTANQTSSGTILVDDMQNYKNIPKIAEVGSPVSTLPERFALHQNYPNPFNPVTTIQYDLSDASDVQLIVYDLLGQEIATLVNSRMEAGYHKVLWNGRNQLGQKVSSGVYIYLLKAGDYVGSKKLLMIK